jgi:hypothetical protein
MVLTYGLVAIVHRRRSAPLAGQMVPRQGFQRDCNVRGPPRQDVIVAPVVSGRVARDRDFKVGLDSCQRRGADVMAIDRPGALGDIAALGLTLSETKRRVAGLQQEIVAAHGPPRRLAGGKLDRARRRWPRKPTRCRARPTIIFSRPGGPVAVCSRCLIQAAADTAAPRPVARRRPDNSSSRSDSLRNIG